MNLEHSLRSGIHLDINNDVFYGSKNSSETNTQKIRKHIEVLDFLKETKDSFQNMEFKCILLTIPVTITTAE